MIARMEEGIGGEGVDDSADTALARPARRAMRTREPGLDLICTKVAVDFQSITLSTAGLLPALERLASEPHIPNLAVSLTGATNAKRDVLMPINRKYPIEQLLEAVRKFPLKHRQRVTFDRTSTLNR